MQMLTYLFPYLFLYLYQYCSHYTIVCTSASDTVYYNLKEILSNMLVSDTAKP